MDGGKRQRVVAMQDDALVKQLRDLRETHVKGYKQAKQIAEAFPGTDIGRECAGDAKRQKAAIESIDTALNMPSVG